MEVRETIADRVVKWFDPIKGAARLRARQFMSISGGFAGASTSRRGLSSWYAAKGSADAVLLPDLPTMRDRCRDLVRNSPLAGGAISSTVTSVVGTGLSARPQVDAEALGMNPEEAKAWNKFTSREFSLWADSPDCDLTRTLDFYQSQDLTLRAVLESGDCLTILPFVKVSTLPYELRIQTLEADRLSNPNYKADSPLQRGGVDLDGNGAPLRYNVTKRHPGDIQASSMEWDKFEAFGAKTGRRNVLHHFRRLRPGQNRGIPMLAPVIETVKQLDRYTHAEVMAAVVSGMFTVFVKSEGGGLNLEGALGDETGQTASDKDVKLGYGAIVDMKPGEEVNFADPGRPNANFDPFFIAIVRQIGVGLEIPFEILLKHFSASYSASRAAMVEAWKFYRGRREWLVSSFCQPVYEAWLEEAVAIGRIDAPGFFDDPAIRKAYCGVAWHGDAMPQIDPEKEINAATARIAAGLSTHARETAALTGADWETEHIVLAGEIQERKEKGTILDLEPKETITSPTGTAPSSAPKKADPNTDSGDGADSTPPEDSTAKLASSIMALAMRENPAPVVSFKPSDINVTSAPVNVTTPDVHVSASPVNVTLPPIQLAMTIESPKGGGSQSVNKRIEAIVGPNGETTGYTVTTEDADGATHTKKVDLTSKGFLFKTEAES